jgi:SulP family sulfate permease
VRHIPHAVTVGFTCGIALTILASQLKDLGGLVLGGAEPGRLIPKLVALAGALPTLNPATAAIGLGSAALIFILKWLRPTWPGMVIAVVTATLSVLIFRLPVETVGARFGELPHGLSLPSVPPISVGLILQLLPTALSFTLLGAVESLLSAKVADGMTARRHRSNMELVAQGFANVASAMFGGVSVTGTIARTATNIRAGARTPIAGMLHSVFLLMFLILAAPLAAFVPLAALAGLLTAVCWNMAEKAEFVRLLRHWSTAVVLLVTFGLTVVLDLTTGIVAGCVAAALIALARRYIFAKSLKTGAS